MKSLIVTCLRVIVWFGFVRKLRPVNKYLTQLNYSPSVSRSVVLFSSDLCQAAINDIYAKFQFVLVSLGKSPILIFTSFETVGCTAIFYLDKNPTIRRSSSYRETQFLLYI